MSGNRRLQTILKAHPKGKINRRESSLYIRSITLERNQLIQDFYDKFGILPQDAAMLLPYEGKKF